MSTELTRTEKAMLLRRTMDAVSALNAQLSALKRAKERLEEQILNDMELNDEQSIRIIGAGTLYRRSATQTQIPDADALYTDVARRVREGELSLDDALRLFQARLVKERHEGLKAEGVTLAGVKEVLIHKVVLTK